MYSQSPSTHYPLHTITSHTHSSAHSHTVCRDISSRYSRVMSLLGESERELDSLKHELVTQNVSNSSGLKDIERRLRKWEWKSRQLKKMKQNFNQAGKVVSIIGIHQFSYTCFVWLK